MSRVSAVHNTPFNACNGLTCQSEKDDASWDDKHAMIQLWLFCVHLCVSLKRVTVLILHNLSANHPGVAFGSRRTCIVQIGCADGLCRQIVQMGCADGLSR